MQLEQKYELLEAISDQTSDRDQTIPAWERSTGKQVFVHLLAGGYTAENNVVLTVVGRLSPEHRQHVLGAGDHLGNAYVITDALPWGVSLRQWIDSIKGQEAPLSSPGLTVPPPAAAKPDAPDAGKLTRAGTWRIPAFNPDKPNPPKAPPVEPPHPAHTPIPASPEDAITQEMPREPHRIAVDHPITPERPAAPPPIATPASAAPPPPPAREPGEFTQMIRSMSAEPSALAETPSSPPPAPAQNTGPGEFTQLLRSYKAGGSKPAPPAAPAVPVPPVTQPPEPARAMPSLTNAPAASSPPGEFTGWITQPSREAPPSAPPAPPAQAPWQFDQPSPPAAPPVPQTPPAAPGGFTGMFQGQPQHQHPPTPAMSAPPAPLAPHAEGEFTRMMRTPAAPGGVFAPPPPQGGPADADLFKAPGSSAPAKSGPSFTQVIAARTPEGGAPTPAAPAAQPPAQAAQKPPYLVLGIVLGLVLILAIALILVLVLRK